MPTIRVGLAQINPVVGDLPGNVARILEVMAEAEAQGCDLLALPELAVTGYPPEDLLLRPSFVRDNLAAFVAGLDGCGAGAVRFSGGQVITPKSTRTFEATAAAVYAHAVAGDRCARAGLRGILALDVAQELRAVLAQLP